MISLGSFNKARVQSGKILRDMLKCQGFFFGVSDNLSIGLTI